VTGHSNIDSVLVPRSVADDGQDFLRQVGATGSEGMVLWVGTKDGAVFTVTDLVIPQQRGIRTPDGVCVVVDGTELQRLNLYLYKSGRQLIAQLHSHPTHAYHSAMDDEYAIARIVGSFSLVIPDFAVRPFSLDDCAIYRLNANGHWLEMSGDEVAQTINLVTP
jgi:hypothetical protein